MHCSLDADGFPTTDGQLGLRGADEPSQPDADEPQLLLVQDEEAASEYDDAASAADARFRGLAISAAQPTWAGAAAVAAGRRQLSRQSSKQAQGMLSAGSSFNQGSGAARSPKQQHDQQAAPAAAGLLAGGPSRKAGPMQRFLKHYSLDTAGLFSP